MLKRTKLIYSLNLITLGVFLTLPACNRSYHPQQVQANALLLDDSTGEDSLALNYIAPYKDSLDAQMDQVIGFSAHKMRKGIPESCLTNFIADLILKESQSLADNLPNQIPRADIALINHKGLRTILEEGAITLRNIFQLMPFENEIVLITLNKSQTIDLLNYIASIGGDGTSGVRFTIKNDKAHHITVNDKSLHKDTYVVATSDYLAKGGDNYFIFKEGITTHTHIKLRDMIIDHIKKLQSNNLKANSQLDNRIKL